MFVLQRHSALAGGADGQEGGPLALPAAAGPGSAMRGSQEWAQQGEQLGWGQAAAAEYGGADGGERAGPPGSSTHRNLRLDIPGTPAGGPALGLPSGSAANTPQAPLSSTRRPSTASPWLGPAGTPGSSPAHPGLATPRPTTSPSKLPGGGPTSLASPPGPSGAGPAAAGTPGVRPGTPQIPGATHPPPRGAAVDVPAATAAAAAATAEAAAEQQRRVWEAMAAAEDRGTLLWSFLNGLVLVPLVSVLSV